MGGVAISLNTGVRDTGTQRVTIATNDLVPVTESRPATATASNVSSSASSVTILASNSSRKGAMLYNDSNSKLYLLFGSGTASTTNYTVQLASGTYYEVPFPCFTGQLTGIWASANGAARVTELT